MMRVFFGRGALALTCLGVMNTAATAADVFSPSLRTYDSASMAAGNIPVPKVSAASFELDLDPEGGAVAPQSWWPLLYSALVPGTGELSMGYEKRGIALIAAEAVAWTGYFKNHSEGMDQRAEYEAFADAHWKESTWIDQFPGICPTPPQSVADIEECGQLTSGQGIWPGYIPYIPKEKDKQHYYENLGKYDWFISGWDDWKGLNNSAEYYTETDNRTKYRSMRQESNNSLDDADSFLWISFAARAFSLAETAIIIHKRNSAVEAGGAGGGSPIALRARPRGKTGGEVALEIRW